MSTEFLSCCDERSLHEVKKGERIKLNPEYKSKNIFIRGDYLRDVDIYELRREDNQDHVIYLKGETKVYVNFED